MMSSCSSLVHVQLSKCYRLSEMCMLSAASVAAEMLKDLPAVQETWLPSLGREDALEKEMATHSRILAWRIPWTEKPMGCSPRGRKESDTTKRLTLWLSFHASSMLQSLVRTCLWERCCPTPKLCTLLVPLGSLRILFGDLFFSHLFSENIYLCMYLFECTGS